MKYSYLLNASRRRKFKITPRDFREYQRRLGLSNKRTAQLLGVSPMRVSYYRTQSVPWHVGRDMIQLHGGPIDRYWYEHGLPVWDRYVLADYISEIDLKKLGVPLEELSPVAVESATMPPIRIYDRSSIPVLEPPRTFEGE